MKKEKKPEPKSDFLSIRISPPLKEKLLKIAQKQERSLSWIVAKIIEKYLQEHPNSDFE